MNIISYLSQTAGLKSLSGAAVGVKKRRVLLLAKRKSRMFAISSAGRATEGWVSG